jgi:hypothetical protein
MPGGSLSSQTHRAPSLPCLKDRLIPDIRSSMSRRTTALGSAVGNGGELLERQRRVLGDLADGQQLRRHGVDFESSE